MRLSPFLKVRQDLSARAFRLARRSLPRVGFSLPQRPTMGGLRRSNQSFPGCAYGVRPMVIAKRASRACLGKNRRRRYHRQRCHCCQQRCRACSVSEKPRCVLVAGFLSATHHISQRHRAGPAEFNRRDRHLAREANDPRRIKSSVSFDSYALSRHSLFLKQ